MVLPGLPPPPRSFADVSDSKNTPAGSWALTTSHRLPDGSMLCLFPPDEQTVLWETHLFVETHRE